MAIDRKFLDANNADLVSAILAEGRTAGIEEGRTQGAQAERDRIKAVEAQAMPGHEVLIGTLKFDGKTTGPEAAVQVLAAEKAKNAGALSQLRADAPQPVPAAASADGDQAATAAAQLAVADAKLSPAERAKAQFERDPKLKAEFQTVERYTAFIKAEQSGLVRRFAPKAA